jgi:hypothetical protein
LEDLVEPVLERLVQQTISLVDHEEAQVLQRESSCLVQQIHQTAGRTDENVDQLLERGRCAVRGSLGVVGRRAGQVRHV